MSRFLPVLHSLVPLTVGMSGYSYRRFLAWTAPRVRHLGRRSTSRSPRSPPARTASSPTSCTSPATSSSASSSSSSLLVFAEQEGDRARRAQAPHRATRTARTLPAQGARRTTWKTERMPPTTTQPPARPKVLWLARLEYRFHSWRERRARARGLQPTVTPFPGYGGRRLGAGARAGAHRPARAPQRGAGEYESVRGWRSFAAVPVGFAQVRVTIAGVTHEVVADRGGVIDTVLAGRLEPGWQTLTMSVEGGEPVETRVFVVGPGRALRRRVRRRRHRDGDRAAPPAAGRVELLRRRRARPPARARDGRADGAARARPPGRSRHLPVDRRLEHRAHAHPIPPPPSLPAGCDPPHRLGPDARPLVPQRQGRTSSRICAGSPPSSRTSSGC